MSTNQEVLAGLRIIGAVARADGKISKEERALFTQAVSELSPKLPDGTAVEDLLTNDSDLEADLATVQNPAIRRAVFEVAYAMSASDGAVKEEGDLLKQIRAAFSVKTEDDAIAQMVSHDASHLAVEPTLDATERAARVKAVIDRRSLNAGILGAIPVPLLTDIGVLLQVSAVIDDIALVWGQPLTRQEKIAGFGALLSISIAQTAAHSLIKLIPGWGTVAGAVSGAVGSYVVVGAIGRAVNYHFEQDGKTTGAELRRVFHEQKADVKKSYEADKERIERARAEHAPELEALAQKLEAKEITKAEYEKKLEALLA
ncbi:MAG: hypothetical protein U0270_01080 [Labilithrix sp.]